MSAASRRADAITTLRGLIWELQTGKSAGGDRPKARGHRTVPERRRAAFSNLCGRMAQAERHQGNWVVPDEDGTIVAQGPTEDSARAAGARVLGWRQQSVVVVPIRVAGSAAEVAMEALTSEFGDT